MAAIFGNDRQIWIERFQKMADRFRRIAASDIDGLMTISAACARAGQLATNASLAGIIPFAVPEPLRDSDDAEADLETTWLAVADLLAAGWPDHFPTNPSAIGYSPKLDRESAELDYVPLDWRIRAENYAAVCDGLIEWLQVPQRPDPPRVGIHPKGVVRVQDYKITLINRPGLAEPWKATGIPPQRRWIVTRAATQPTTTPFVPNDFQRAILAALDRRALKNQALANEVCKGEGTLLYRKDGLKELRESGLVAHKNRLGFYRPDRPPATA